MTTAALPGLDVDRLEGWFERSVGRESDGPLAISLLAGGRSNLTYLVVDGARRLVLRRPPLGHVQETAHDMAREHRMLSALRDTSVPVPRAVAFCDDPAVLGAPFYLMEHVDGVALRSAEELGALGPVRTRRICESLVDALVDLHRVDPREVGLETYGRPEGFVRRQADRWARQMAGSRHRDLAGVDELAGRLRDAVRDVSDVALADGSATIVHGDYRLDNVLVSGDRIQAIVDWEMATLGDPLTDLALLVVYGTLADRAPVPELGDASTAPGFLGPEAVVERYLERSGRQPQTIGVHVALASFKLAAIFEGIHLRVAQGAAADAGFGAVGDAVEPLLAAGLQALDA